MRNLKRVLSLTLASAMLFGMMVMGASATDKTGYADQDSITKTEAVAVLTAIGVFQGTDGKFNPAGVLTRESAAKIITYMVMGKTDADALSTSGAPFTDVAASRWSAGSIAYCVSQGIISGDGQGNFYPEKTVNGYAFAKMLLGALGYNATSEGLTGTGWEVKVATLAKKAGLNAGLSANLNKDMTREQAAQMALNTLKADTVTYSGNITIGDIVVGGSRDPGDPFFKEYTSLKMDEGKSDGMGRPGTKWTLGAKVVGTYGSAANYTYTAGTKESVIKDDLGDYLPVTDALTVTMNGKEAAPTTVKTVKNVADLTKNGRSVEVYTKDDAISKIVIVDTYLTTITTVNTTSKYVQLAAVTGVIDSTVGKVYSTDNADMYNALVAMGKDAKVLLTVSGDANVARAIETVALAETVNGTYTAKASNGDRTIGGEKYADAFTATATLGTMEYKTSYDIVLDSYGYLMDAKATAASTNKYAYVANTDMTGSVSSSKTFKALLVFAEDGTQEWVDVAKVGDKKAADIADLAAFQALVKDGSIIAYGQQSDGNYTLKNIDKVNMPTSAVAGDSYVTFTGLGIEKGKANFITSNGNILGSSKTIFLVKNDSKFTVYTGVKNVPNMTDAKGTMLIADKTLTANFVVIDDKENATDSSSLAYIVKYAGSRTDETVNDTVHDYQAIVNGENVTLTLVDGTTTTDSVLAGLYTVSYDSNSYGIKIVAKTADAKSVYTGTSASVSNGTIALVGGTKPAFVTSDDFKAVVVDKDGGISVLEDARVQDWENHVAAYVIMDADGVFATSLIVVTGAAS